MKISETYIFSLFRKPILQRKWFIAILIKINGVDIFWITYFLELDTSGIQNNIAIVQDPDIHFYTHPVHDLSIGCQKKNKYINT